MISERDEFSHVPGVHPRWQENYFVICWSVSQGVGFMMHCKRWPSTGHQTARVVVAAGGKVVSRRVVEPVPPNSLTVDGLRLEPVVPFRELRLSGGFKGTPGFGPLGFIAWRGEGAVSVDLDVVLKSDLPPADFTQAFHALAASAAQAADPDRVFENTQTHYEQGGRCEGFIAIDGKRHAFQGLFVRDHTWGPRDEGSMSEEGGGHGFWTATVLDEGNLFFNAMGRVTPDGTHGVGVVVDKAGQSLSTDVTVEFNPSGGLRTFDNTRVRIGGSRPIDATGRSLTHLVKYLPGSGPRRFDDNGISEVKCGDLVGFGVHEFAGTLSPEEAAIMEAAED